jgi:hypothetical protein
LAHEYLCKDLEVPTSRSASLVARRGFRSLFNRNMQVRPVSGRYIPKSSRAFGSAVLTPNTPSLKSI